MPELTIHDCEHGVEITFEYNDTHVTRTQVMFEDPVPLERIFNINALMQIQTFASREQTAPPTGGSGVPRLVQPVTRNVFTETVPRGVR